MKVSNIMRIVLFIVGLSFAFISCSDEEGGCRKKTTVEEESVYQPSNNPKITEIALGETVVYKFEYDNRGRIYKYTFFRRNSSGTDNTETYVYTYSGNNLIVKNKENVLFRGKFSNKGALTEIYRRETEDTPIATFRYGNGGYLSECHLNVLGERNAFYLSWDDRNDQFKLQSEGGTEQLYEYFEYANNTNLDLNALVSNCNTYEKWFSDQVPFALFYFFGQGSKHLVSYEKYNSRHDFTMEYERDGKGLPLTIWVTDHGELNNTGTRVYRITYQK